MGTVLNGVKWSGASINGTVPSGIIKDGKILYKSSSQYGITLKNIIENSDLSNGSTGFSKFVNAVIIGSEDNCLLWRKQSISSNTYILSSFIEDLKPDRKYYGRCSFIHNEEGTTFRSQLQLNDPNIIYTSDTVKANNWATVSGVFNTTTQYRLFLNIQSSTQNIETIFKLKEPMFIDVTDLYNAMGFQTDEDLKSYMDSIGFFTATKEI